MARLRQGGTIRHGIDTHLWIALGDEEIRLPLPPLGVGGTELVVSPDERFAALFLYSGQSEQGWELFSLTPLRHHGSLPYLQGEGDAPLFSPSGRWLVMFVARAPTIEGSDEWAEDVLGVDAEGTVVVDWATLVVQSIPDGFMTQTLIGTPVPLCTNIDIIDQWNTRRAVGFDGETLVLTMPFGEVINVTLPPDGAITTHSA